MSRNLPLLPGEGGAGLKVLKGEPEYWEPALPMATRTGEAKVKGPMAGNRKEAGLKDAILQVQGAPSALHPLCRIGQRCAASLQWGLVRP